LHRARRVRAEWLDGFTLMGGPQYTLALGSM
jgi:hypothetical protein